MRARLDLTGRRFGHLLVTGEAPSRKKIRHWFCTCDCGQQTQSNTSNLNSGNSIRCGRACLLPRPVRKGALILVGLQVGRLTVLRLAPRRSRGWTHWICRCVCGTMVEVDRTSLRQGRSKSCGRDCPDKQGFKQNGGVWHKTCTDCDQSKPMSEYYKSSGSRLGVSSVCKVCNQKRCRTNRASLKNLDAHLLGVYDGFNHALAKDRKVGRQTCSPEEFFEAVNKPCAYCGWYSSEEANTADRIDNSLGHMTGNINPACLPCNQLRGDRYTVEDMKRLFGPVVREARRERERQLGFSSSPAFDVLRPMSNRPAPDRPC